MVWSRGAVARVERHLHVRDGLLEQVLPRHLGGRRALGPDALLVLRQLVRLVLAEAAQVMAVARHLGRRTRAPRRGRRPARSTPARRSAARCRSARTAARSSASRSRASSSLTSTERRSPTYEPAREMALSISAISAQRRGQAGGVELGDAAAVALGEGVAGGAGLVGQACGRQSASVTIRERSQRTPCARGPVGAIAVIAPKPSESGVSYRARFGIGGPSSTSSGTFTAGLSDEQEPHRLGAVLDLHHLRRPGSGP